MLFRSSGRLSNGMGFDSLRVFSRGRLSSPPSAAADVAVTRLSAGERSLGNVASTFTVTDHISIDRFRETLGDTTLSLRGNVRFRDKAADATLDSVTLAVGPRQWNNVGPVQATLEGDKLGVSRFSLATDTGRIDAAGDIRLEKSIVNARA